MFTFFALTWVRSVGTGRMAVRISQTGLAVRVHLELLRPWSPLRPLRRVCRNSAQRQTLQNQAGGVDLRV